MAQKWFGQKPSASRASETLRGIKPVFELGRITPLVDRQDYLRLKEQVNVYETPQLVEGIRANIGYRLSDLEKVAPAEAVGRMATFHRIERLILDLQLTYEDGKRKSGNTAVSHPLRTMLLAAALRAWKELVLSDGLHDIIEDTRNGRLVFRTVGLERRVIELKATQDALDYIEHTYGREVMLDVLAATRGEERIGGVGWQGFYKRYLSAVYRRIGSAFAKWTDAVANIWELEPIKDKAVREEMVLDTLLKASWQVGRQRKISWLQFEIMLMAMEEYSGYLPPHFGLDSLRKVGWREFEKFVRGYALCGERGIGTNVLKQTALSGSPIISVYGRGPLFEAEFPFLHPALAMTVLQSALGRGMEGAHVTDSLLPYSLRYSSILKFESSPGALQRSLPEMVSHYDSALKGSSESFDRKEWSDAALESGNVMLEKGTPRTLFPGSAVAQGQAAQQEQLPLPDGTKAKRAAKKTSLPRPSQPLAEGTI